MPSREVQEERERCLKIYRKMVEMLMKHPEASLKTATHLFGQADQLIREGWVPKKVLPKAEFTTEEIEAAEDIVNGC